MTRIFFIILILIGVIPSALSQSATTESLDINSGERMVYITLFGGNNTTSDRAYVRVAGNSASTWVHDDNDNWHKVNFSISRTDTTFQVSFSGAVTGTGYRHFSGNGSISTIYDGWFPDDPPLIMNGPDGTWSASVEMFGEWMGIPYVDVESDPPPPDPGDGFTTDIFDDVHDFDQEYTGGATAGDTLFSIEIGTLGVLSGWGGSTSGRQIQATHAIQMGWYNSSPLKPIFAAALLGFAGWRAILMSVREVKKSGGDS